LTRTPQPTYLCVMKQMIHTAATRGHAQHGWLDAHHSFSFGGYYDPARMHFGVLRVLNDDRIAPGMGFGMHPHDNMEIITIALEGSLKHKDNLGNEGVIGPNDVQVMSAGTGVVHSEFNPSKEETVNLLQIWVFPNKKGRDGLGLTDFEAVDIKALEDAQFLIMDVPMLNH